MFSIAAILKALKAGVPTAVLIIMFIAGCLIGGSFAYFYTSSTMKDQVITLTEKNGDLAERLERQNGNVRSLQEGTQAAMRAREQAEALTAALLKIKTQRVERVKTIEASTCAEMVTKIMEQTR